jgi:hypothetical protein
VTEEAKDKVAEESEKPKKPSGYREFEKLLKQVVKAPPLRSVRKEEMSP